MAGALHRAAKLDWRSKARFAVVMTDSPGHGSNCNDCADDRFPDPAKQPGGQTIESAMRLLADDQMDVSVMLCKVGAGAVCIPSRLVPLLACAGALVCLCCAAWGLRMQWVDLLAHMGALRGP